MIKISDNRKNWSVIAALITAFDDGQPSKAEKDKVLMLVDKTENHSTVGNVCKENYITHPRNNYITRTKKLHHTCTKKNYITHVQKQLHHTSTKNNYIISHMSKKQLHLICTKYTYITNIQETTTSHMSKKQVLHTC